jgi:hypothetical protein
MIVAATLPIWEAREWTKYPPTERDGKDQVTVRYTAEKVAKLIYPTEAKRPTGQ